MNKIQILAARPQSMPSTALLACTTLNAGTCSSLGYSSVFAEEGSGVCSILFRTQPVGAGYVTSDIPNNIPRWSTLGFGGMNFHSCKQTCMFRNVPYKLQLQILRFDVKPSIYLCFGTDASRAVLKNGIRNGTIGREIGIVELMGYMNLKGIQRRGKFFSASSGPLFLKSSYLFLPEPLQFFQVMWDKTLNSYLVLLFSSSPPYLIIHYIWIILDVLPFSFNFSFHSPSSGLHLYSTAVLLQFLFIHLANIYWALTCQARHGTCLLRTCKSSGETTDQVMKVP